MVAWQTQGVGCLEHNIFGVYIQVNLTDEVNIGLHREWWRSTELTMTQKGLFRRYWIRKMVWKTQEIKDEVELILRRIVKNPTERIRCSQ